MCFRLHKHALASKSLPHQPGGAQESDTRGKKDNMEVDWWCFIEGFDYGAKFKNVLNWFPKLMWIFHSKSVSSLFYLLRWKWLKQNTDSYFFHLQLLFYLPIQKKWKKRCNEIQLKWYHSNISYKWSVYSWIFIVYWNWKSNLMVQLFYEVKLNKFNQPFKFISRSVKSTSGI